MNPGFFKQAMFGEQDPNGTENRRPPCSPSARSVPKGLRQVLLAGVFCLLVFSFGAFSFAPSAHAASVPTVSAHAHTGSSTCFNWQVVSEWTWSTSYGDVQINRVERVCSGYIQAYCTAYDETLHGAIAHVGIQLEVYDAGISSTEHVYPIVVNEAVITGTISFPAGSATCFVALVYS